MFKLNTFLRSIIVFCVSVFFHSQVLSQELKTLTGSIVAEDGSAATGASVRLAGSNLAAIADGEGHFSISNIDPGTYTLIASMVGYKTFSQKLVIEAGVENNIRIVLTGDSQTLQTVEITGRRNSGYKSDYSFAATKTAIPVTEIPSTVSTITQQLIRDRQAVRFDDVARNTNVRVTNNGRSVVIRGFVSTTRLINGLRTLNENYRFPSISPVVESYEVVKGPSSSMFGNMSPGGVVNLVTKKPLAEKKQSLSFSTGSFNTVRGDMDFTGKVTDDGKVLYRLNAFGQLSDTWYQNMKDNAVAVAPSFSFLPTDGTRFNVDLNYTQLTTMENDGLFPFKGKSIDETPIGFTVLQAGDRNKTTTTSINLSASQRISQNISFNVSYLKDFLVWDDKRHAANVYLRDAAWSHGDSSVSVAYSEWNTKMDSDNITGYFSADFNTGKIGHKALLGYDYNASLFNWGTYRYSTTDIGSVNVYDPAKSSTLDGAMYSLGVFNYDRVNKTKDYASGIYFQDQVSVMERLKVMLGLRYESYTFRLAYQAPTENEVSQKAWLPKVGITYSLRSNTHVYGSYITGFQPVSSGSLVFGTVEGGGELKPEYSNQFELGVKQELFNKNLLLTVAAYQIKKINVTQLTNPSVIDANDRIWRQLGEVTSKGFEVEANGQISRSFSVNAAYNYNDAKITEDLVETNIGLKQGLAPAHQGNIWAKYEASGNGVLNGVGLGAGMSFSSKTPMLQAPTLTTPGYSVIDAAISYKINRVMLNLNINNIANKRYYTGAVRATERFYTGAPRNIMFRIGYSL
ncbi:TonB-dependent receptor [Dyadobacter pollutisoli]|uniref:TonB-dependent receptor n=1 Tax=Dyadobacter pollutisoli TaxID=2910158 RepID=A0A9E8NDK9_9BACT|nr:TonB-dependent receptor [Dyadobacter pollutisoli]WAC13042.1 TonB-dependent receptor [Dyadobacter pollutisoli]